MKEDDNVTGATDGASFMPGLDDDETSSDEEVCIPLCVARVLYLVYLLLFRRNIKEWLT